MQAIHSQRLAFIVLGILLSSPVFALSKNVDTAITLLKQTRTEQCQRNALKVQLLVAHRKHDLALLKDLEIKLDEMNKQLKPIDDQLMVLKAQIKKNPDEETELNTALLDLGSCE